jgi:hypothetical protein
MGVLNVKYALAYMQVQDVFDCAYLCGCKYRVCMCDCTYV